MAQRITILDPSGRPGDIPAEQLEAALAQGYSQIPAAGAPPPKVDMKMNALGAIPTPQGVAHNIAEAARSDVTGSGTPGNLLKMAGGALEGLTEGPKNLYEGYQQSDPDQMVIGAGQTLTRDVPLAYGAAQALRAPGAGVLRGAANQLEKSSVRQQVKALGPSTPEYLEQAKSVAPQLAGEGDWAVTGKRYDALNNLKTQTARSEWKAAAESVPKNADINVSTLLDELHKKIESRQLQTAEGTISPNEGIVGALGEIHNNVQKLTSGNSPNTAKFAQLKKYESLLDDEIESLGGYRATGKDGIRVKQLREATGLIRDTLSKYDDRLSTANADLSTRIKIDEISKMRDRSAEMSDIRNTRRLPVVGNITDDLIAGGAGYALGGVPGAVTAEGVNLLRQSRGVSSARSAITGKMASGARGMADRLSPRYRGLLGAGNPLPGGGQDMESGIIQPEPRTIKGQLTAGGGNEIPESTVTHDTSSVRGVPAETARVPAEADAEAWRRLTAAKKLRSKSTSASKKRD